MSNTSIPLPLLAQEAPAYARIPYWTFFKKLAPGVELPRYATPKSSGFDFISPVCICVKPGQTVLAPTWLAIELPEDTELQIRARSSLALKKGLIIPNAPGTVDEDYRGEIKIMLTNIGKSEQWITIGERVAQGVIVPVIRPKIMETMRMIETERGAGGFGSTGGME